MCAKLILVGSLILVVVGVAGSAVGQDGYGFPYAFGGYYYSQSYLGEWPPYFALHPPVYYSHQVPRTYGYSPFPYPPYVLTPGSEMKPTVIQNVYSGGSNAESDEQQGPQPLRIDNPYVEQPDRSGVTKAQRPVGRRPQIVYPASLAVQRR